MNVFLTTGQIALLLTVLSDRMEILEGVGGFTGGEADLLRHLEEHLYGTVDAPEWEEVS